MIEQMSEEDDNADDKSIKNLHNIDLSKNPTNTDDSAKLQRDIIVNHIAHEFSESSVIEVMRDYIRSPAAGLAREFANSPMQQIAKQVPLEPRATFDTARIAAMREALKLPPSLAAIQPIGSELSKLASLGDAIQSAQKSLEEAMRPLGGVASAIRHFEKQQRATQELLVASLAGPVGDTARAAQWASTIGKVDSSSIVNLLGGDLGKAVDSLREAIARRFSEATATDQVKMSALLGLNNSIAIDFAITRLKMSALAGIGEAFDPRSSLQLDAYHALFGEWRSRPDLPQSFWHDTRVRERMYREAGVDDGLIVATPDVALDIMIESGLTAGLRSESNTVAVVVLGEVSMIVRGGSPHKDAYNAITGFEQELRRYISRKLEERFGPEWFRLRASNLLGKAKQIRKAAMERGEKSAPLIEFVELGDLNGIILDTKNWNDVFGDVFINKSEFDHDMQKLVAIRRPAMHARPIDGVRLTEMLCVMWRLSDRMKDDGAWKIAAESDR